MIKTIAIGNPGVGKSTLLNSLAKELLFKSGISRGGGLTDGLEWGPRGEHKFADTPGLADRTRIERAARDIETGLKGGGKYRILFVTKLNDGRCVNQDVTTMVLVLKAAQSIGKNYCLIFNQVDEFDANIRL